MSASWILNVRTTRDFLARKTITMPEEEGIRLPGDLHALIAC